MEIVAPFVADEEAAVAVQPGKGALNDPAMSPELRLGLDAWASDTRGDVSAT